MVRSFLFNMAVARVVIVSAHAEFVEQVVPTNAVVRVVAANLNGNTQSYQPFALRILRGLKPDVVAINEFNYGGNTAADFRFMVTNTFGTNYVYFRETGNGIPNGVISRWPIIASGEWDDPTLSDRDFSWARIDVPGSHDLFVVSVHLKASGGSEAQRQTQAAQLRTRVQADFPAGAYVVIAGDFNLQSRSAASEPALTVFGTFMRDTPVPTDQQGDPDTNNGRNRPYDVIVQSPSLTTNVVPVRIGSQSFANGLVFDSRVFNPLADVAPVLRDDSGLAQHMAVVKDYRLNYTMTNRTEVVPPHLTYADGELRWNSPTGLAWRVESTSNLVQWTPLATNAAATTNRVEPVATEGFLARFLRLILQR